MNPSLYIHIPFCKSKCKYCDFTSFSSMEAYSKAYIKALCKEILSYKEYTFETIFIGGGTPTYLSLEDLSLLLQTIALLKKSTDCEITIECNPGTIDYIKAKLIYDMGVNRVSIGLQSTKDEILKSLGRIHNYEKFLETFNTLRAIGFKNINIDIMFGLPSQKLSDYLDTLEKVVSLNPEHISNYSLIVEENTPFYTMLEEGTLALPSEEEEEEMNKASEEILEKYGYKKYEISNYAREGYRCRHNIVYWRLLEYIGCGVAAHSYIGGKRFSEVCDVIEYIKLREEGKSTIESYHINSLEDQIEEYMFMGLRMIEGVSMSEFNKRFGFDIFKIYKKVIEHYINLDLLRISGDYLALTKRGLQLSNVVMSDFILTHS